jgi:hypothetical protein
MNTKSSTLLDELFKLINSRLLQVIRVWFNFKHEETQFSLAIVLEHYSGGGLGRFIGFLSLV